MNFVIPFCETCQSENVRERRDSDGVRTMWCVDCDAVIPIPGFALGKCELHDDVSSQIVKDAKANAFRINRNVDPSQLAIKLNNCATNDPCVLCGERTDPIVGPELFLADGFALVCHDCGNKIAPQLVKLLDTAGAA